MEQEGDPVPPPPGRLHSATSSQSLPLTTRCQRGLQGGEAMLGPGGGWRWFLGPPGHPDVASSCMGCMTLNATRALRLRSQLFYCPIAGHCLAGQSDGQLHHEELSWARYLFPSPVKSQRDAGWNRRSVSSFTTGSGVALLP